MANTPATYNIGLMSLYGQDDWRVTDRLKLTYGIRYDLVSRPVAATIPPAVLNKIVSKRRDRDTPSMVDREVAAEPVVEAGDTDSRGRRRRPRCPPAPAGGASPGSTAGR